MADGTFPPPPPSLSISTERLLLRPFARDDINAYHQLQTDRQVTRWARQGPNVSREQSAEQVDEYIRGKDNTIVLAVTLLGSGTFIGTIGTFRPFELGFSLLPAYWSAGYATEAARAFCEWHGPERGTTTLTAKVDGENISSKQLLLRCGFAPIRDVTGEGSFLDFRGREIWRQTASDEITALT